MCQAASGRALPSSRPPNHYQLLEALQLHGCGPAAQLTAALVSLGGVGRRVRVWRVGCQRLVALRRGHNQPSRRSRPAPREVLSLPPTVFPPSFSSATKMSDYALVRLPSAEFLQCSCEGAAAAATANLLTGRGSPADVAAQVGALFPAADSLSVTLPAPSGGGLSLLCRAHSGPAAANGLGRASLAASPESEPKLSRTRSAPAAAYTAEFSLRPVHGVSGCCVLSAADPPSPGAERRLRRFSGELGRQLSQALKEQEEVRDVAVGGSWKRSWRRWWRQGGRGRTPGRQERKLAAGIFGVFQLKLSKSASPTPLPKPTLPPRQKNRTCTAASPTLSAPPPLRPCIGLPPEA